MPTLRLEMTFKNTEGRTSKISVDNAKSDLTELEVNEAMDGILTRDVFTSPGGDLIEKAKAELVTTEITEFEIV
jgi:hypothetical protein